MRPRELVLAGSACWLTALAACGARADEPAFRFRAPIEVHQPGTFVQLPLPPSAYAKIAQRDLIDLRIVDADGARVPFAVLTPRARQAQSTELLRSATLYPLPKRPSAAGAWQSPVEISVQGEHISVKRLPGAEATPGSASAGWLIDTGERKTSEPAPQAIHLQWSGPAEFTAGYDLDSSDDLRRWRRGTSGQVMALSSPAGALTQPRVPLPEGSGRFVRLRWADANGAPALSAAQTVSSERRDLALDAPTELQVTASPEPAGKHAPDADAKRSLHFDIGAVLPVVELDLKLAPGTRVAPVRIQARATTVDPWRDIGSTVFYRLERDGRTRTSPPLALQLHTRYLRVLPDERAALLDPARTRLALKVQLANLVFAAQGRPPLALLAGSPDARPGALPVSTLVPALDNERPRFGQSTLGAWSEAEDVTRAIESKERQAARRPYLLWTLLLVGVTALGWMVWRLSRSAGVAPPTRS